ncbi:MAG: hypothetical protein NTU98_05355 [Bacteroidetes bacterium]|nr:hypothetical protein [Bacteroidota bacterium]
MGRKPGSGKRSSSFLYRTRRKIRYLRHRGTLFHTVPRQDRQKCKRSSRLKRMRRWRRRMRHIFFNFRPSTVKRYNRILQAEIRALQIRSLSRQTLPERLAEPVAPVSRPVRKYSFSSKIHRSFRKLRFLYRQTRKKRRLKTVQKKPRTTYRKLRYLYTTGELFRVNFLPFLNALYRNFSFLWSAKYLKILINSTFTFLLSYLVVFFLKELAISVAAHSIHVKTVMMYYDVEFLIRSRDWTADMVQVIYSTGPVITGLIAVISLTLYGLTLHESWMIRLFFLWTFLHALSQSLGDMIFGVILNQGFGWVLAYSYYTDTDNLLFVSGILLGMILAGIFLTRFLLLSGNIYFNFLDKENQRPFFASQIFLPFIISSVVIVMMKVPIRNNFDFVVESSMLLLILPGMIRARYMNDLFFDEEPRKIRFKWIWILASVAAIILFRVYFFAGIRM